MATPKKKPVAKKAPVKKKTAAKKAVAKKAPAKKVAAKKAPAKKAATKKASPAKKGALPRKNVKAIAGSATATSTTPIASRVKIIPITKTSVTSTVPGAKVTYKVKKK